MLVSSGEVVGVADQGRLQEGVLLIAQIGDPSRDLPRHTPLVRVTSTSATVPSSSAYYIKLTPRPAGRPRKNFVPERLEHVRTKIGLMTLMTHL